jgi:hypothetical protein
VKLVNDSISVWQFLGETVYHTKNYWGINVVVPPLQIKSEINSVFWLVRWFVGSLVRWFVGSLVRWFACSLVRWFNEMRELLRAVR